jgi:hypothetical protein
LQDSAFSFPPSFFGCKIDPPPRVDDMKIRVPRFGLVPHPEISRRYRILRSYAASHNDHANQLEFSVQELRTARFHTDGICSQRFWFGALYELVSDFGRSFVRPLAILTLSTLLFGLFYFSESVHAPGRGTDATTQHRTTAGAMISGLQCVEPAGGGKYDVMAYAMALSFRNSLVVPGVTRSVDDAAAYRCLYGSASSANQTQINTTIPIAVSIGSSIQALFSGIMIFLCGLALRNILRFN